MLLLNLFLYSLCGRRWFLKKTKWWEGNTSRILESRLRAGVWFLVCFSPSCIILGKSCMIMCLIFFFYKMGTPKPPLPQYLLLLCMSVVKILWNKTPEGASQKTVKALSITNQYLRLWPNGFWTRLVSNREILVDFVGGLFASLGELLGLSPAAPHMAQGLPFSFQE